jgi:hypothetical protein
MSQSAFYGGRYGPVGPYGRAGSVACGTVGLAYRNVPCTGAPDTNPQLNAFGLGGRTAPGGVLPTITGSIPPPGSPTYGGSPFNNPGNYGGFVAGLPTAGGVYGGGPVYGANAGLVSTPGVVAIGRRLLGALPAAVMQGWRR